MIQDPKRRGEWVEMQFMARAAAHDLTVSKPWGDSSRYDFAVDNGKRFFRVQVKSTSCWREAAYYCHVVPKTMGRTRPYATGQIDFFAAYIIPEDIWFILPAASIKKVAMFIRLNPHNAGHRYFRYMEAWHVLQGKRKTLKQRS